MHVVTGIAYLKLIGLFVAEMLDDIAVHKVERFVYARHLLVPARRLAQCAQEHVHAVEKLFMLRVYNINAKPVFVFPEHFDSAFRLK